MKTASTGSNISPNLNIYYFFFRAATGHWRGLRFESAPFKKELTPDNTLYVSKSKSILKHVEIIGAGRGHWKGKSNATSAIETWGCPPVMEHILIENSAYNGKKILAIKILLFYTFFTVFLFIY